MKIKISIIDDHGKQYEGTFDVPLKGSVSRPESGNPQPQKSSYKGLSGGIRFLIGGGFFNTPKSSNETYSELKKEGYYHSIQTVDSTLRKIFVANKKTLTRLQEQNVWKYVLRK